MSDTETCHVVVLGFDPQLEPPAVRLQRVFGLDAATCEALLENLPATVQRSVPRVRAEYFRRALLSIGAQVEVRSPGGELIEAPPAQASVAPAAMAAVSQVPGPPEPKPDARAIGAALHSAATEPLPQFLQTPQPWAAEPSPWAVDPTSRTLAQVAPAAVAPSGSRPVEPVASGWNAASPWSLPAPAPPAEPTAFVGPPAGMPPPQPSAPQPAAPAWPAAPQAVEQPELRAPAAPTLREAPAPLAEPAAFLPPATSAARPLGAALPTAHALSAPAAYATPPVPAPAAAAFAAPAPAARGGALDLASLNPPRSGPDPFALAAGSAPIPAPAPAHGGGLGSRLPSDIWDAPVPDSRAGAGPRDPSGIYDPPVGAPLAARTPAPAHTGSTPPPAAGGRLSSRPTPLRSSAPPPPAALEHALRSSPPPPAGDPGADDFKVLHGWNQLRGELEPGASRPAPSARPAPRAAAPVAGAQSPAARAARSAARPRQAADLRSFWKSFGDALALPFSGPGPYWIAGITVWSVAAGALGLVASFSLALGMIVSFCAQTALVAIACDYFRACFWAPAVGARALDRAPDFNPARIASDYVGRGLHLSLFLLLSQVTAIAWVTMSSLDGTPTTELLLDPITWLLFFFPYGYWPMGVALTALRNDFGSIWSVLGGVRAIVRAPLEYLVVVLVGFAVLAVPAVALCLLGAMLGLEGTILSGTLGLPLALSHGIQGALMGHLTRARREIFE